MAVARVVTFDNVTAERIQQLKQQIDAGGRPEEIPATEILLLHDADDEKSLVVLFFDSDEDYRKADEALSAMASDETPGQRTSVTKYTVAGRMTA